MGAERNPQVQAKYGGGFSVTCRVHVTARLGRERGVEKHGGSLTCREGERYYDRASHCTKRDRHPGRGAAKANATTTVLTGRGTLSAWPSHIAIFCPILLFPRPGKYMCCENVHTYVGYLPKVGTAPQSNNTHALIGKPVSKQTM
jgi:hypothetical protein